MPNALSSLKLTHELAIWCTGQGENGSTGWTPRTQVNARNINTQRPILWQLARLEHRFVSRTIIITSLDLSGNSLVKLFVGFSAALQNLSTLHLDGPPDEPIRNLLIAISEVLGRYLLLQIVTDRGTMEVMLGFSLELTHARDKRRDRAI